ncbi:MAG TPA: type I glyceraldehyde-3-phosphate dehydrogenase [Saprospiraceae bacterium]|nr:type I glyceraldehyde-3-phosphate dehydrogenase [Saprospiraceae bacterium]MCB9268482.1 type I glyceraldehyde-3-phosphate dehydrogenase [Lewinellaceae bacterium]HPG07754.1 type I glyceraldehyde-3-phosphate dehydrogenase [Saprospiraceae bacterium]HPR01673.1 type I glyceraldehyde-3-phosphate dehydrogenase [Saprospiraceae bacterium]HRV87404.1 type I glyceraldehyde-3-phosphate dehydrogenase [Saprospiraceae bacterium]
MPKRIAINGFGRIGRLTFRNLLDNPEVEVVAINDLTDNETLAHLLKYDTAHGPFKGTVSATDEHLIVNGKKILASAIKDPATLPWKENNVDVVLECTGIFTSADKAAKHLEAGAKKVVISAPGKGAGIKTIVLGVNGEEIADDITIYSNASCTTNCLTPVVKVVMDNWGLQFGSMSTIHAYTGDQNIQDAPHRDLRRARAAAQNIVPTSTGAANAVSEVIPAVKGKFFAIALRVPVITGSMIECNFMLEKNVTVEEVNAAFKKAATEGPLKGILEYTEDPIVSSDIIGNKHSSIFDSGLTDVKNGNFVKLVSWYDNEAGYSARLADLTAKV